MADTSELYSALREVDVSPDKARAIVQSVSLEKAQVLVDLLKRTSQKDNLHNDLASTPAFLSLQEKELVKLRDELLELLLEDALRSRH